MNDADTKAFEAAEKTMSCDKFSAGWKAACEWRDSQVGEPVFYARQDQLRKVQSSGPGLCVVSAEPTQSCLVGLYTTPLTAQINQQLVEVLEYVRNVIPFDAKWADDTRNMIKAALAAAKGVPNATD